MKSSKKIVRKSFLLFLISFLTLLSAVYFTTTNPRFNKNISVLDPNGCNGTKIGFDLPTPKRSYSFVYSALRDRILSQRQIVKEDGMFCEIQYFQEVTVIPLDFFAAGIFLGWLGVRARKAEK